MSYNSKIYVIYSANTGNFIDCFETISDLKQTMDITTLSLKNDEYNIDHNGFVVREFNKEDNNFKIPRKIDINKTTLDDVLDTYYTSGSAEKIMQEIAKKERSSVLS